MFVPRRAWVAVVTVGMSSLPPSCSMDAVGLCGDVTSTGFQRTGPVPVEESEGVYTNIVLRLQGVQIMSVQASGTTTRFDYINRNGC